MTDKNTFKETIKSFNNQEEPSNVAKVDPIDGLKKTLFSFFSDRLTSLQKEDDFKQLVKESLISQIEGGEASFNQLLQLYKDIQTTNTRAVDSILEIMKPAPAGNVSLLIDNNPNKDDTADNRFKSLSETERDSLSKFSNFINNIDTATED